MKPFGWASERGVDHLQWDAESEVCVNSSLQRLAPTAPTTTPSACWQFCLCRRWHMTNETRDSWVLKSLQWAGLRHLFACTNFIWHRYNSRQQKAALNIAALIWSHALVLRPIFTNIICTAAAEWWADWQPGQARLGVNVEDYSICWRARTSTHTLNGLVPGLMSFQSTDQTKMIIYSHTRTVESRRIRTKRIKKKSCNWRQSNTKMSPLHKTKNVFSAAWQ